jgi:GDP-L-fucose synthase
VRILVTGGHGFLGRSLIPKLHGHGYVVFAPRSRECDLTTPEGVRRAISFRPDMVVHLAAAVGGIGANVANPGRFLYENAIMGLQLMEQARLAGVGKFLTVGTACEYPEHASLPLKESELWEGYPAPATAPYGLAKRLILAQGQAYRQQYGLHAIHVIPTNLYGPGDNFDVDTSHVIPGMIRRFSEATRNKELSVQCWGTGRATREFLHVDDATDGIVAALERYDDPEPVNLGTGVQTSIRDVAEMIADVYGYLGSILWDDNKPDGTPARVMDTSKARAFGFEARVNFDVGLRRTIEWYER